MVIQHWSDDLIPTRSASEAETAEFLAGASGWYDDEPPKSRYQQPASVPFSRSVANRELALSG